MEKVEAKLKQKQEKRDNVTSVSATSNYSTYDSSKNASASQSISRKIENQKDSDTNRSFDINISNFDVSFGNK